MVLGGLKFDLAKVEIRPDAGRVLDDVERSLAACPQQRIRIEAHTDSQGSAS